MCKEKRIVYLAGIGMGTKEGMTVQAKESLKGCDCMIGAKRLLEEVSDADCVCHAEYLPEKIEEYLRKHPQFLQDRDCTFRGCRILQRGKKNWKKF